MGKVYVGRLWIISLYLNANIHGGILGLAAGRHLSGHQLREEEVKEGEAGPRCPQPAKTPRKPVFVRIHHGIRTGKEDQGYCCSYWWQTYLQTK